jgi:hypothetical protein
MNCHDAQKLTSRFINDNLSYQETEEYIKHLGNCPDCREELNIQYLVEVGMLRLEDASNFNLNKEISDKIKAATSKSRRIKLMIALDHLVKLIIMIGMLAISVYWLIQ